MDEVFVIIKWIVAGFFSTSDSVNYGIGKVPGVLISKFFSPGIANFERTRTVVFVLTRVLVADDDHGMASTLGLLGLGIR